MLINRQYPFEQNDWNDSGQESYYSDQDWKR